MLDVNALFSAKDSSPETPHQPQRFRITTEETTICFYVIMSKNMTWHMTFDFTRHQQAVNHIGSKKLCLQQFIDITISLNDLKKILASKAIMPEFSPSPFLSQGTTFQKQVWRLIAQIPFGARLTYGDLAKKLGNTNYARAVGGACNSNPVALLIPCHRVVGKNTLGGFAGGEVIKEMLLELEK